MKKQGFSLIEIIISVTLFLIIIFPLVNYNKEILKMNRALQNTEMMWENFNCLNKQLLNKNYSFFENHIGKKEFSISNNKLLNNGITDSFFFPHPFNSKDKIMILISEVYFSDDLNNTKYFELYTTFENGNRFFSKKLLISPYMEDL